MGTYQEDYTFNFFSDGSEEIQEKTRRLIRKLMDLMVESDYVEINKLLQASKKMRYSIQGYEEEVDVSKELKAMLKSAGYTTALMDVMQLYVEKLNAQNEILKVKTKYRDTILRILAERGTLLHGDLAKILLVSTSALNAIIKQMNATSVKLINVEEVSKYKLYSITPVAYKYIMKLEPESTPRKNQPISPRQIERCEDGTSKFENIRVRIELDMEYRSKEEQEGRDVLKMMHRESQKYDENYSMNTEILKYRRLA